MTFLYFYYTEPGDQALSKACSYGFGFVDSEGSEYKTHCLF